MRLSNLKMQTGFLKKKPVVFLLVVILFYKLSFNSFTGNFLLNYVFSHFSTGSYTGKVNQFSLLYGLDIESVIVRSGKEFDEQILFSCDRLRILYNLPYLFFGKIKLTEISITKPFIQILEKNGNWNITKLFPTSPKEKEARRGTITHSRRGKSVFAGECLFEFFYRRSKS